MSLVLIIHQNIIGRNHMALRSFLFFLLRIVINVIHVKGNREPLGRPTVPKLFHQCRSYFISLKGHKVQTNRCILINELIYIEILESSINTE